MQMSDSFIYKGERAEALALSIPFSFSPARNFGIKTISWCTANHRGFWCNYVIVDLLTVQNLYLTSQGDVYPTLNGIEAAPVPIYLESFEKHIKPMHPGLQQYTGLPMQYMGLNYDVDYTGRIVVGCGINNGQLAEKRYQKVLELQIDGGILMDSTDITGAWKMAFDKAPGDPFDNWWEKDEHSYFDLLNYHMMGIE